MNFPVKIYMKWYDRHNKICIGQLFTDFLNSLIYFNLVSCSSKNQVPYFILDKGCDWLKLDTALLLRGKKCLKKTHLQSGLPIHRKLWDTRFFCSALLKKPHHKYQFTPKSERTIWAHTLPHPPTPNTHTHTPPHTHTTHTQKNATKDKSLTQT